MEVPGSSKVVACIDLYPQSQAPRRAMVSIRLEIKVLSTTAKKIFGSHVVNFVTICIQICDSSGHENVFLIMVYLLISSFPKCEVGIQK